jgi:hypothetical protein
MSHGFKATPIKVHNNNGNSMFQVTAPGTANRDTPEDRGVQERVPRRVTKANLHGIQVEEVENISKYSENEEMADPIQGTPATVLPMSMSSGRVFNPSSRQ